jgi:hypothetical protein
VSLSATVHWLAPYASQLLNALLVLFLVSYGMFMVGYYITWWKDANTKASFPTWTTLILFFGFYLISQSAFARFAALSPPPPDAPYPSVWKLTGYIGVAWWLLFAMLALIALVRMYWDIAVRVMVVESIIQDKIGSQVLIDLRRAYCEQPYWLRVRRSWFVIVCFGAPSDLSHLDSKGTPQPEPAKPMDPPALPGA